jgi:hypothetical protein
MVIAENELISSELILTHREMDCKRIRITTKRIRNRFAASNIFLEKRIRNRFAVPHVRGIRRKHFRSIKSTQLQASLHWVLYYFAYSLLITRDITR